MTIIIQTADGRPIEQGILAVLRHVADKLNRESGKTSAESMTKSVKNWV